MLTDLSRVPAHLRDEGGEGAGGGGFYYLEIKQFWLDKPARLTIFGFVSDCQLRCEKKQIERR